MWATAAVVLGGALLYFVIADITADYFDGKREAAEKDLGPAPDLVWRLAVAVAALFWPYVLVRKGLRALRRRVGGADDDSRR